MKKLLLAAAMLLAGAAVYASTIRATLSWTDATGETGYRVERATTTAGPWTLLASIPADSVSYVDNTLALGSDYCWRLTAFNAVGDATTAPTVCASSPSLPTPPGGLQVIITVLP